MANHRRQECLEADQAQLKRVNYFPGQLLTAADMRADQEYFLQKFRRHNFYLHGSGVVCGLGVSHLDGLCVQIERGYALGPYGDEIFVPKAVCLDLASCRDGAITDPCDPGRTRGQRTALDTETFYVAIRYEECLTDPVSNMAAECGCEEVCDYSRIRDSFEIACLEELPTSRQTSRLCDLLAEGQVGECPICPVEPWVPLAAITVSMARNVVTGIDEMARPPLHSTWDIQEQLIACCCRGSPLSAPRNLICRLTDSVNPEGGASLNNNLIWDYEPGQASEFIIYRSLSGGAWQEIARLDGALTSYVDTDIEPETSYHYRVRAFRDGQESGDSNISVCDRGEIQRPRLVPRASCNAYGSVLTITITNEGTGVAEATNTRVTFINRPGIPPINEATDRLVGRATHDFDVPVPEEAWFENEARYTVEVDTEGTLGAASETLEGRCQGLI